MPADFFPKREAQIVQWSNNFHSKINIDPMQYGLTVGQAADYALLQSEFAMLYQQGNSNATRTPSVIQAKKTARIALEDSSRQLANIIRAQSGVDAAQRDMLGLPVRNPGGPRGRHWTQSFPKGRDYSPEFHIKDVNGLRVRLQLRDRMSPMNMSLPKGVHRATIFYATGELPPALGDREQWKFLCNTARTIFDVAFEGWPSGSNRSIMCQGPALQPMTRLWFTAFWENRRAQRSDWCEPIDTRLGYGLALAS